MTAIIIVNYNKYEDTFACVESILQTKTKEQYRIIIVDNASPNDSWEKLQKFKENNRISLLLANDNRGYCAGNNIGITFAMNNFQPDYIWILNPDTLIASDTLENLHNFAENKHDLGILGCKLIYYPDTQYLQALGGGDFRIHKYGELRPGQHLYHLQSSDMELPDVVELDLIIGASMYIPVKVFKQCGLMNERFHLYADENEFCLRVAKFGFKHYAISNAAVYHKEGWRQLKQNISGTYYNTRNTLYLIQELFPNNLKRNLFLSRLKVVYSIIRGKFKMAKAQYIGIRDFLHGIDGRVDYTF